MSVSLRKLELAPACVTTSSANEKASLANEETANNAARAVINLNLNLDILQLVLILFSRDYERAALRLAQLRAIRVPFNAIISDSINLANISAQNAAELDDLIVRAPGLSPTLRKFYLQRFKDQHSLFQHTVEILRSRLVSFKDSYSDFADQLAGGSAKSEVKQETQDLYERLKSLLNRTLPSAYGEPINHQDKISHLTENTELRHILEEGGLHSFQHVLESLKPASEENLDKIFIMQLFWVSIDNNALQINSWLKEAVDRADFTDYMDYLEEGARIYRAMSVSLKIYAGQVS